MRSRAGTRRMSFPVTPGSGAVSSGNPDAVVADKRIGRMGEPLRGDGPDGVGTRRGHAGRDGAQCGSPTHGRR